MRPSATTVCGLKLLVATGVRELNRSLYAHASGEVDGGVTAGGGGPEELRVAAADAARSGKGRRWKGVSRVVARGWSCGNVVLVGTLGVCYLLASLGPLSQIAPPLASSGMVPAIAPHTLVSSGLIH
jgi:hypothetical protein